MSWDESPSDQIHELASLYALDALDEAERDAFEAHLKAGCPECNQHVKSFREAAAAIGEMSASAPPPRLRERLMSRAAQTPGSRGIVFDQGGILLARSSEMAWVPVAPGIEFKLLSRDAERKYTTSLVRMAAGTRYPSHRHHDVEEVFLLSGDFHVAGQVMHANDYCRAGRDTVHEGTFTKTGCTFLLIASQENEVLG